jgi:hypothetical protein
LRGNPCLVFFYFFFRSMFSSVFVLHNL